MKMIAILMKVFKNLFGNGSKIHAGEIVGKDAAGQVVGLDMGVAEVGQNANGSYVRWNNGLQVCWANLGTLVFDNFESYGDMWRTPLDALEFPYPKSFFERPVPGGGMGTPYNYGIDIQIAALNDRWRIRARSNKDRSGNNLGTIIVSAIGWWKEPGT